MTAYANLRNTLAKMYQLNYYNDTDNDIVSNLIDEFKSAINNYEDFIYNTCKTDKDWDSSLERIDKGIRKAAKTASHNDKKFIYDVLYDYYDADFYGIQITV